MVELENLNLLEGIEKVATAVPAIPEAFRASTREVYDRVRDTAATADHRSRKSAVICAVFLSVVIAVYLFVFVFSESITEKAVNQTRWAVRRLEVANKTDCSLHDRAELCMRAVMDLDITNDGFFDLSVMGTSLTLEVHGRLSPNQRMARHELGRAYLPEVHLPARSTTNITMRQFWPIASMAVYSLLRDKVMSGRITELEFDGFLDARLLGVKTSDIHLRHKRARLNNTALNLTMPDSVNQR
ncbi:hypothetical protein FOZ61_003779 [Perkinsus olseni]|uniref:Uncharacterized protein n=1 Tax=Perkinsus olseni TaxID=32597 RepID=A0A7J6MDB6_PEROL|nr:hypothetical protein FOZ61_003779 [Perkinsus olseni]KAF4675007.1 hypothetical protein FOL46_003175 [Perkinsus olseni]